MPRKPRVITINQALTREEYELNFFTGRSLVLMFTYPHTYTGTVLATVGVHPRKKMVDMLVLVMGQVVHIETDRVGKARIMSHIHMFPSINCEVKIQ